MALTVSELTYGNDETDASNYTTVGSVSVAAGSWVLADFETNGGSQHNGTIVGRGLSFTCITQPCADNSGDVTAGWAYCSSAFNDVVAVQHTGTSKTRGTWHVHEVTGANTSDVVAGGNSDSTDVVVGNATIAPHLGAFTDATNNAVFNIAAFIDNNGTVTQQSGYNIGTQVNENYIRSAAQWKIGSLVAADNDPTMSSDGAPVQGCAIALELAAAGGGGGGAVGPGYYYQHYRQLIAG